VISQFTPLVQEERTHGSSGPHSSLEACVSVGSVGLEGNSDSCYVVRFRHGLRLLVLGSLPS